MFLRVLWAILGNWSNPRRRSLEPQVYGLLVRSTGDKPGLTAGIWSGRWTHSYETEPTAQGVSCYPWVNHVRIDLNCRTPSWCLRITWWCGRNSPNPHALELGPKPPFISALLTHHPWQSQRSLWSLLHSHWGHTCFQQRPGSNIHFLWPVQ